MPMTLSENKAQPVAPKKEGSAVMNIQDILKTLPHRYPFLLIDRVTELVPMEYIKAYKNVTFNEPFFQGHFPDQPIMPGVLIVEAMAQAGIVLVASSLKDKADMDNALYVFSGIEKVRFRKPVLPGDKLEIICKNPRNKLALWKMEAEAYVDGKLVASAELTAAKTPKA